MATEILQKTGTPVCFADATDYSSTNSGITRTDQIDLTNLLSTAARQSDKIDLNKGGGGRAASYAVRVGMEMNAAPLSGEAIAFYWSSSFSTDDAVGNDGGASGADGTYKASDEAEWIKQLIFLGSLALTADGLTVPQYQTIGVFYPPDRYGQLIVYNTSLQAMNAADADEMFVALIPIIDESQ